VWALKLEVGTAPPLKDFHGQVSVAVWTVATCHTHSPDSSLRTPQPQSRRNSIVGGSPSRSSGGIGCLKFHVSGPQFGGRPGKTRLRGGTLCYGGQAGLVTHKSLKPLKIGRKTEDQLCRYNWHLCSRIETESFGGLDSNSGGRGDNSEGGRGNSQKRSGKRGGASVPHGLRSRHFRGTNGENALESLSKR